MKSKLEHSIAELHKLKNQIRVELNQIRPNQEQFIFQKKEIAKKRFFNNKYETTDIVNPSLEKSLSPKQPRRRYFDPHTIVPSDPYRSGHKKHYKNHYEDSVSLDNSIRRRTCSYFNIRKDYSPPPQQYENTSLIGIGSRDPSNQGMKKGGIRTFHGKFVNYQQQQKSDRRLSIKVYRNQLSQDTSFY